MDWDDVRSFLAIARTRSLSGAARELGVRQSTMSRRLEAMEARNGARLLQRTTSGYELTALGEAVLGNAERMEAEAIAVERMVQGRDVALSGVVRLTTVEVIANLCCPARLWRYRRVIRRSRWMC
jgi:DNA-binding transcriptional LysR family regulator